MSKAYIIHTVVRHQDPETGKLKITNRYFGYNELEITPFVEYKDGKLITDKKTLHKYGFHHFKDARAELERRRVTDDDISNGGEYIRSSELLMYYV